MKSVLRRWLFLVTFLPLTIALMGNGVAIPLVQSEPPPFGLPFQDPPGPETWLLIQPYGNTISAYRQQSSMYAAGQGLHFGVVHLGVGEGLDHALCDRARLAGPDFKVTCLRFATAAYYGR